MALLIVIIILCVIMSRIEQALKAGFRHLVFEDNYDTGTGDHYSLRQICDQFYIRGVQTLTLLLNYHILLNFLSVSVRNACKYDAIDIHSSVLHFLLI